MKIIPSGNSKKTGRGVKNPYPYCRALEVLVLYDGLNYKTLSCVLVALLVSCYYVYKESWISEYSDNGGLNAAARGSGWMFNFLSEQFLTGRRGTCSK